MIKRWLPFIMAGISGIIIFLVLFVTGSNDKEAPVIEFGEVVDTFSDEDDLKVLLNGVKAVDKVDGDITDTLSIQNIIVLDDRENIMVHYSAVDKSNNIGKAKRKLKYTGSKNFFDCSELSMESFLEGMNNEDEEKESPTKEKKPTKEEQSSKEDVSDENIVEDESVDVPTEAPTEPPVETPTEPPTEAPTEAPTETPTEVVANPGAPVIKLKYNTIKLGVGSDFFYMDPIDSMTDDKDDPSRLVQIEGTYDLNTPGTYNLVYYIIDTDDNISNKEKLEIIVE